MICNVRCDNTEWLCKECQGRVGCRISYGHHQKFEGAGVYYGATFVEAQLCGGEEVIVVGGGNSAGQAAVFLAQTAKRIFMLVRSAGLATSMSRYEIFQKF